jgi:hypothetical protein
MNSRVLFVPPAKAGGKQAPAEAGGVVPNIEKPLGRMGLIIPSGPSSTARVFVERV